MWRSFCEQTNEPTLSQRRRRCKSQETKKEKSFVIWRFQILCYLQKIERRNLLWNWSILGYWHLDHLPLNRKPINLLLIPLLSRFIGKLTYFFAIMIPILTLVVAIINLDSLWRWFPSERNSFQDWMFRLWSWSSTHKQMQIWNRLPLHNKTFQLRSDQWLSSFPWLFL